MARCSAQRRCDRLSRVVTPALERLLDPSATGRGGAVFAALSGPEIISLATPMPLASRVVLDSRPFVRPLLELLDEGEPAGVVLTSAREAEVLDWRLGALRRLTRVAREPEEEHGQNTTPHDQRARRERDRQLRWIEDVAADVSRLAGEHGWERLLISGDERLTGPLIDALPVRLRANALLDARRLHENDQPALAAAIAERLGQDRAGRNARLSRRVRAAALGAQRGALGLSEVVAALNEGRAEHVIYDSALRYSGADRSRRLTAGRRRGAGTRQGRAAAPGTDPRARIPHRRACHACRRISGRQPRGRRRHRGAAALVTGARRLVSILIWVMVGIAIWHFAVLVPDRFWGGIIGAFLAALLGALASGFALPTPGIPLDNPPGWTEALWPVPGSLLALTASYLYGARLERTAGEDDR